MIENPAARCISLMRYVVCCEISWPHLIIYFHLYSFVVKGVDTGSIILQCPVPILPNDTVDSLTQRIHQAEYFAYPTALRLMATGAVRLAKDGTTLHA